MKKRQIASQTKLSATELALMKVACECVRGFKTGIGSKKEKRKFF